LIPLKCRPVKGFTRSISLLQISKSKIFSPKLLRKITVLITQKHAIFLRKHTQFFCANTCCACLIITNGYLYSVHVLLYSKNPLPIFTVQKLTDMVPTTKIFRSLPPGGLGSGGDEAATWWEF
jgi:hypothetical protein